MKLQREALSLEYLERMRQIRDDERKENMRAMVSRLSERFAGIENFEELGSKAISYLKKIASGEIRVHDSILYSLVEIEMVLSRYSEGRSEGGMPWE